MKIDMSSVVVGVIIAAGGLALYDYLVWTEGGILARSEWY